MAPESGLCDSLCAAPATGLAIVAVTTAADTISGAAGPGTSGTAYTGTCHQEDCRRTGSEYGVSTLKVGFFVGKPVYTPRRSVWFRALTVRWWWRGLDSNQRRVSPTDLQSVINGFSVLPMPSLFPQFQYVVNYRKNQHTR